MASDSNPGSQSNWYSKWCYGIWPDVGGQSTYEGNCYGHDEPGIQFYSNLPGSGGNITYTLTLPTDRSPTANQSDLYVTFWFGMTLTDPFAWMDQCFLELQFYPDSSWYAPWPSPLNLNYSVYGQWVGAAVAWQIQASSGYENPCFYEPLYANGVPGPAFLNMTQGDKVTVTLTGWPGNALGEQIAVNDVTQAKSSSIYLFNKTCSSYTVFQGIYACGGNYPLDPSYVANNFENGLQWTPGGEYPSVFAFETGHTGTPAFPSNNPFGGCSPGGPTPNLTNPSVPCPSYDPSSWVNDTVTPFLLSNPVFFNAATRMTASQVGFTQDLGGISFTAGSSLFGSFPFGCSNRLGASFCSYPWYSYSCTAQAFEFGATDFAGVSQDFGKYNQYATTFAINGADYAFYPPTNFSIPTCGAPSDTVTVGATSGGYTYFLSNPYTTASAVTGVAPGVYSIHAVAAAGMAFTSWAVTGSVGVDIVTNPWATLTVFGTGSVTAQFAATGTPVTVHFNDSNATGTIVVSPGFTRAEPPVYPSTLATGSMLSLLPGIYNVQAMPPIGNNFTSWTVTNGGVIASKTFPYTWLVVTGSAASVTVTANSANTRDSALFEAFVFGNGTATFNGVTIPYYGTPYNESFTFGSYKDGSYKVTATPKPGWVFSRWYPYGNIVFSSFYNASITVTLETGFDALVGVYSAKVTLGDSPVRGGAVSYALGVPVPSGTVVNVFAASFWEFRGFVPYFPLVASQRPGYTFNYWTVSSTTNITLLSPYSPVTWMLVNAPGTVVAYYTAVANHTLSFVDVPAAGGTITFNFNTYGSNSVNRTVPTGEYLISANPAPGYSFSGWHVLPLGVSVFLFDGVIFVAANASIVAVFHPTLFPVSFISTAPLSIWATINGQTLWTGETIWLAAGTYPISLNSAGTATFTWSSTSALAVSGGRSLTVTGSGAVYALVDAVAGTPTVTPVTTDAGATVAIAGKADGYGVLAYSWVGLPAGCTGVATLSLSCPSVVSGTYAITLTVTDANGVSATSPSAILKVNPTPSVAAVFAPAALDWGGVALLTATVTGGTAPFSYTYAGLPSGCAGSSTSPTLACIAGVTGTFVVSVAVTDAVGTNVMGTAQLVVNPLPSLASFSVAPTGVTTGATVSFAATVSGGTGPISYSYVGLPATCGAPTTATFNCAPGTAGTYNIEVIATDVDGHSVTGFATLSVSPAPGPALAKASDLTPLYAIGALGVVLGVVALVIALARRGGRPPPPGPLPPYQETTTTESRPGG